MKIAWLAALIWAGVSLVLSAFGPLGLLGVQQSAAVLFFSLLVISLSLAVRRGNATAAWCLFVIITFDVGARLWQAMIDGIVWPVVVCVIVLRGALYLHKHRFADSEAESWVRALYELAFLQATGTAVIVVWSLTVDPVTLVVLVGRRITVMNLIDVVILVGLGLAAWKRQVWAGYGLVLYQLANVYLVALKPTSGMNVSIPLGLALVYGLGVFHLHRLQGPMSRSGRVALGLVAVLVLGMSVSLYLKRGTSYQRLVEGFFSRALAVPGYRERLLASKEGPLRAAAEITLNGARRLTDAELVERARLLGIILSVLDEHNCAEQFRGGRGTIESALPKIPEGELRAWLDLSYVALLAEIESAVPAVPNPSDDEIAEAMGAVRDALSADEAARFEKIALESGETFQQTEDSDTCWWFRTMVNSAPQLEAVHQRTVARLLVAQ